MEPTTRTNLLIFFGATAVLAALWFVIAGVRDGSPVRIALGICLVAVAVTLLRVSRTPPR